MTDSSQLSLKQLNEISRGLCAPLDYNTLIDSILLTCMGQMLLLKAGIFLKKNPGIDYFTLHRNNKGFEIDHTIEYNLHNQSRIVQHVAKEFRCYDIEELDKLFNGDPSFTILESLEVSLVIPLLSRGDIIGIIILGGRIYGSNFSESEKEYLLSIASMAGIALHNTVLNEMATTDMMTKLKIHHYFQTFLIEEIERTRTYNKSLSLIMADIDHFKDLNDTYGHAAGDRVLMDVACLIMENIRQMDIAARYGGEEFAIILPDTDIKEALIVAERIRQNIEKSSIQYNDKDLTTTISIGVTQYNPVHDTTKNMLIERADKALYISKRNGRNLVTFL